jgi:uncharacterized protein YggU (UPF0235/DUF167 family)
VIKIQQGGDGVTFSVKVHPKARRERISGTAGDSLKVELTAPPVEGKPIRLASASLLNF